jgi:hypothetical protein
VINADANVGEPKEIRERPSGYIPGLGAWDAEARKRGLVTDLTERASRRAPNGTGKRTTGTTERTRRLCAFTTRGDRFGT